jgi:inhibitor of KinA
LGEVVRNSPEIRLASDRTLLIRFSPEIKSSTVGAIQYLTQAVLDADLPGVLNVTPAWASLLITFHPLIIPAAKLRAHVEMFLMAVLNRNAVWAGRLVEIPVCYGGEFGPDLDATAELCQMSAQRLVDTHANAEYLVGFLGFAPGFAYLSGLPRRIAAPRLSSPRTSIPAGSVGIAGEQTGIYPQASPGGWRLIGRTPMRLFRPEKPDAPGLLRPGDRVQFLPIGQATYERILQTT